MKKFLLCGAALAALGAAVMIADVPGALAQEGDRHAARGEHHYGSGARHHGRHHRAEGRRGERRAMRGLIRLQENYDIDGDGAVTQAEIDEARATRVGEFDADGSGALSLAEYEALWLDAMRERMVRRFQSHDRDGDGTVTAEEFQRRTANMVMMRDRNGDGALSVNDLGHGRRAEAPEATNE
ncbi:MAG: EF-hand domain-containing protein [Pseudomonadota bacterium]